MQIRLARASDAPEIYDLFKGESITRQDLTLRRRVPKRGFFEYPLSYSDIALRSSNDPFSLVMEGEKGIVAYLLGYNSRFAAERVVQSGHKDPVIERAGSLSDSVYLDQVFLQKGLPLFILARLMDTWETIVRGEKIERVVISIPQGEWTNRSSLRFALDRGFSRKGLVDSCGVQLGVLTKPYLNLDEDFDLS